MARHAAPSKDDPERDESGANDPARKPREREAHDLDRADEAGENAQCNGTAGVEQPDYEQRRSH